MKFSIYIDQLTLQHWRGTGGARTDEQMNMKYRLDTNKFGRSINSLVTLEELREMGAASVTVRGDEILDEDGVVATFPKYCTQNEGDCETCNLAVFGRDCADNWVMWPIKDSRS